MRPSQITAKASTGDVVTSGAYLRLVVLTAGSDTATVIVKAGGASGTTILTLAAVANTTASSGPLHDVFCSGGIHVTLSGTGPAVTVVWT